MKSIIFEGKGRVSVREKPMPLLKNGDVLVKIELCGVCFSDLLAIEGELTDYSPPVVMGHEIAGIVVKSLNPVVMEGEKVTINPIMSCGTCDYCRNDLDKYCRKIRGIGHDIDGGYAEFIVVSEEQINLGRLIVVPDSVSNEELIFLEPLGCCLTAIHETSFGRSVAILGAGPIGQIFAQLTSRGGLETFLMEPLSHRRKIAKELSVCEVFNNNSDGISTLIEASKGGVDTVISATHNDRNAIDLAFQIVRRGGSVNLFGLSPRGQELRVSVERLHHYGHKLMASWAFSRWSLDEARRMIIGKSLELKPMVTDRFPIDEGLKALENTRKRRGMKTVISNSDN